MTMKLPCAVVRDLLPLYAEKLAEEETQRLVDEHLEDCAECRRRLAEMDTGAAPRVESAKPLIALKKEINRRRRFAAMLAALCVFVAVYTWFYRANEWKLVPWEDGLIEVIGVEERPYEAVYGETSPDGDHDATVEALVLQAENFAGTEESMFRDEDGTETVLLQGWTSKVVGNLAKDYNEMLLCPVPDRVIYDGGGQQRLIWGEPLNGGVKTLPRLALGYYAVLAAALAIASGIVWLVLRNRDKSWIARQVFFAPLSYIAAHLLIKGFHTESYFMSRDFFSILLLTAALYALLTLAWQALLRQRRES